MAVVLDKTKIKKAIRNSIPLTVKSFKVPKETEDYLEEILGIYLDQLGQKKLLTQLAYCLRELVVNAKKANTKRIYFEDKGLDLSRKEDYSKGMESFKNDTLNNIQYYLEKQKEQGLYVKVIFQIKGHVLYLSIANNCPITRKEHMRVLDRIARSRAFDTLEQAFNSVLDDTEGAGLGIVIMILMLKKMGLDDQVFDITVNNGETIAKLIIPMDTVHETNLEVLSGEIVKEIDELPQFPDNIMYLQKLISDPESEITDIAKQILSDVSLTADLLKLVNSAQFMLPKKVDSIVEAVKLVGMRGLKNLLYSYGTQKLLTKNSEEQKELWEHARKVAFYSFTLARSFKRKKDILDDVYVGGILHDMGKIIFSNVHPDLLKRIQNFCAIKGIPRGLFEDFAAGLSHAEIGAKIARKWNFPEALIQAIRYHHEPTECDPNHRDIVYMVYLANAITEIERNGITYDLLDVKVLDAVGIRSENQFNSIAVRLGDAYSRELERSQRLHV